jgi:TIR domain
MTSDKLNVFVSYSHKDAAWLERVQVHLKPLARDGKLDLWDDTGIKGGQRWRDEIKAALARADVAVLLISADFYASDFITKDELPPLLEAARSERGLAILGVHINYSSFDRDRVLSEYQTINTPKEPIEDLPSRGRQEKVFANLARRIEELIEPPDPR